MDEAREQDDQRAGQETPAHKATTPEERARIQGWLRQEARTQQQSPMTREELIFAWAQTMGMCSRLIHDCELLLGYSDIPSTGQEADVRLRRKVFGDMMEARDLMRDGERKFYGEPRFYGEPDEQKERHT